MTTRQSRGLAVRPHGRPSTDNLLKMRIIDALEKKFPKSVTRQIPWDLLSCLADSMTLPSSLLVSLKNIIRERDVKGYLALPQRPKQLYGSAEEYFQESVIFNLLKKYPFGTLEGVDPKKEALKSFYRAENQCFRANKRISYFRERYFRLAKHRSGVDIILHDARRRIARLIGHRPDLDVIYRKMSHGPGGVLETADPTATTFYYKVAAERYTVTSGCYPYAVAAILADERWRMLVWGDHYNCSALSVPSIADSLPAINQRLGVVNHNKVTFVPKTAKVHRIIAAEPMMNMYCQKGVGNFLRDRLKDVNVDLDSQSRNQHLAYLGSLPKYSDISSRPVTLDLASASDTLSIELVRELMPPDWFDMLCDLRCPQGILDGHPIFYEKFASMGNGFTFELESLIFWALCASTAAYYGDNPAKVSVYGDDIIVPMNIALACVEVLAFCGFKTNDEKSFIFGPFRESCGKDYFEGTLVRPFYLKKDVTCASDAVYVANSIACLANPLGRHSDFGFVDTRYAKAYSSVMRFIPRVVRTNLVGPRNESYYGHIFCSFDIASKSRFVKWNRYLQCYEYLSFSESALEFRGRLGYRYLQFISASNGIRPKQVIKGACHPFDLLLFKGRKTGFVYSEKINEGSSASTVTRRSRTRPTLNVLCCERWDPTVTAFDVAVTSG